MIGLLGFSVKAALKLQLMVTLSSPPEWHLIVSGEKGKESEMKLEIDRWNYSIGRLQSLLDEVQRRDIVFYIKNQKMLNQLMESLQLVPNRRWFRRAQMTRSLLFAVDHLQEKTHSTSETNESDTLSTSKQVRQSILQFLL